MDPVFLSRLQFAAATMCHFLFVPLTLGLSVLVAYMETSYVRTKDPTCLRMTKFWGKLFLINFALGVVTGITLEFQFSTNWSRYSAFAGDVFGSLLAIEASVAFFLESTLIGVWIFGWNKLSAKAHAAVMWLVAAAFLLYSAAATDLYANHLAYPGLFIVIALAVAGLLGIRFYLARGVFFRAWIASATTILSPTFFGIIGLFPMMLPSSINGQLELDDNQRLIQSPDPENNAPGGVAFYTRGGNLSNLGLTAFFPIK